MIVLTVALPLIGMGIARRMAASRK
jgi:hypothetical protein